MEIKVIIISRVGETKHSQEVIFSDIKTNQEMDFVELEIKRFRESKFEWEVK